MRAGLGDFYFGLTIFSSKVPSEAFLRNVNLSRVRLKKKSFDCKQSTVMQKAFYKKVRSIC